MNASRLNPYIIVTQSLYFGWLLSFPFYGPVLYTSAPFYHFGDYSLPFIFTLSHALSFILGGLLLKNVMLWKKLMVASLLATIIVNTALLFSPAAAWPYAMVLFGIFASLYILGWTYPYVVFVPMISRLKLMALVIIGANIVYISFNALSQTTSPFLVLVLTGIPIWLALPVLVFFNPYSDMKFPLPSPTKMRTSFPMPLMLILCLFILGLYLSSGFMYNIMQPFLSEANPFFIFYRYIPYVAVLVIMWYFGVRLKWYFSIYMGVSLLGLAFVSFALTYESTLGLFMTTNLIEAAYAFIDLFLWTALGDLAFIYGVPFQFFAFPVAAMLFSILAGELIGAQLLQMGEHHRLVTALFAAAAIFLTFSVIPWLNEHINRGFQRAINERDGHKDPADESPLDRAIKMLPPGKKLTPREAEITALLLKGVTNREVADQLFISENTLKTHLRHIYFKFNVTQKRELFSLVVDEKNDNPPPGSWPGNV